MPRTHLEELTRRLRAAGQDLTAEDVADALWLAQWLPGPDREPEGPDGPEGSGGTGGDPEPSGP